LHWWTQVLAFSATYTEVLLAQLRQLTTFPQEVMLCPETVTLRGACDISHLPVRAPLRRRIRRCAAGVPRAGMLCVVRLVFLRSGVLASWLLTPAAGGTGAAVLNAKEAALVRILGSLWFNQVRLHASAPEECSAELCCYRPQALVFCNSRGWAEALADRLCERGFPAAFTCGQYKANSAAAVVC
jgi:hypothetical protein